MNRNTIINDLIKKNGYKSYLEIGTQYRSNNFDYVHCEKKFCVDPSPLAQPDFLGTSDEFFAENTEKWDLIFIDGLHEHEQVERDIDNALNALNLCGTIVCHDMNPTSYEMQAVPRIQNEWTGDCWVAWLRIRSKHAHMAIMGDGPHLRMAVVDCDYGCGIIQVAYKKRHRTGGVGVFSSDYNALVSNRKEWLNLISKEEFKRDWL